tara:strand:- start:2959 stop:3264 length:306 start_codon:yes stop_codon:yes gene_type:complete
MAKRNMIEREKKREALVAKYAARREKLRVILKDPNASYEDKQAASIQMQKLPRDGSYTRQRKRCAITGRPRGVYRKFGLGRHKLREAMMRGEVPGLKMASW